MIACPKCGQSNVDTVANCCDCGALLSVNITRDSGHDSENCVVRRNGSNENRFTLVEILFLWIGSLYFLGSLAAFAGVLIAQRQGDSITQRVLLGNGFFFLVGVIVCFVSFKLGFRKHKLAEIVGGLSASYIGFSAFKATVKAFEVDFHLYHLIEPVLILPAVIAILWKLIRRARAQE